MTSCRNSVESQLNFWHICNLNICSLNCVNTLSTLLIKSYVFLFVHNIVTAVEWLKYRKHFSNFSSGCTCKTWDKLETFIYKNPKQKSFLKLVRDLNAIKNDAFNPVCQETGPCIKLPLMTTKGWQIGWPPTWSKLHLASNRKHTVFLHVCTCLLII